MRVVRKWVPLFLTLVVAACADAPTDPTGETRPGTGPSRGGLVLDPVVVVGHPAGCDPYTDLNGCEGDDGKDPVCMTSTGPGSPDAYTLSGCTGTGSGGPGGGDGGGGGGGSPTGPEPTPDEERPLDGDMVRDTVPPDCSAANLSQWQALVCFRALPPDSVQTRATLQALDEIAKRGEECAAIAQQGRDLLAAGRLSFFVWQEGDAGGYGHRNTGIQLDEAGARLYGTFGSNFEETLVHEIDHVLGYEHIDNAGLETPHTAQCG